MSNTASPRGAGRWCLCVPRGEAPTTSKQKKSKTNQRQDRHRSKHIRCGDGGHRQGARRARGEPNGEVNSVIASERGGEQSTHHWLGAPARMGRLNDLDPALAVALEVLQIVRACRLYGATSARPPPPPCGRQQHRNGATPVPPACDGDIPCVRQSACRLCLRP